MKLWRILWFILMLLPETQVAQETYAQHIHSGMGLPSNTVYNIYQDRKGFMWIATEKGLCRFDGMHFKTYQCSTMGSKSGSYIKEDSEGKIWYSSFDGALFYVKNETLIPFNNKPSKVLDFALIRDTIWLVNDSLQAFDAKSGEKLITRPVNEVYTFYQDRDRFTLFGWKNPPIHQQYNSRGQIIRNWNDLASNVYRIFNYRQKLVFLSNATNQIEIRMLAGNQSETLFHFKEEGQVTGAGILGDTLWITTKKHIRFVDLNKRTSSILFKNQVCTHLIKDRQQNLWVSTMNGVYLIPSRRQFIRYPLQSTITRLRSSGNHLFLFDNEGRLAQLDTQANRINYFWQSSQNSSIYTFLQTTIPGAYAFVTRNRSSLAERTRFQNLEFMIMNSGIKGICRLNDKYLLSVSSLNVELIQNPACTLPNPWDSLFQQHGAMVDGHPLPFVAGFSTGRNRALVCDSLKQEFFTASGSGLWHFSPKGYQQIRYKNQPIMPHRIGFWRDRLFILLNNGELLVRWKDGTIQALPDEFQAEDIKVIQDDFFWWNQRTVSWLPVEQLHPAHTGPVAQRISIPAEFAEIVDVETFHGQLFISAPNQLLATSFNLPKQENTRLPFYLMGLSNQKKWFTPDQQPTFETNHQDIVLQFAIPDYLNELNDLAYQINEESWKPLALQTREINFSSLAPGAYTIRFRINGQVYPELFRFTIRKPIYQRIWFLGLLLFFAGTLIYLWYRYRLRREQHENALILEKANLEKDLRQSMLSSIKSQMNPHFLFNALNTIQSYIISEDKKNASAYLSKFSKLTRRILEMSEKDSILLQEELDALLLYIELEKMRFEDLEYFIEIAPTVRAHTIRIPSMIIQPYVENAIKHGLMHRLGPRHLYLRFDVEQEKLRIQIEDNGIGRQRSRALNASRKQNHQSFSTDANLKRIELLNYEKNHIAVNYTDKTDSAGNPQGTLVTIHIPLNFTL